ncbi:hypothetical protein LRS13_23045 [Svornostia abyssi]|uniref:Lipopolysaccharide biosynthesis protein n=1 Tax=Svornostia abyssi TaxID=2898438 RepID=A0ABY5PG03_9ACTN|nr:hypothetical protein LRS13_23045 [Parviterribacteraceae bacterium J379]
MIEQETTRQNGGGDGLPARVGSSLPRPGSGSLGQAPPSVGVLQAARRYPLLVILPMLFLTVAGVLIGMQKRPTYTAQSRLSVGRINLNAPGALAGYASATQALATQYARSADATPVIAPVAEELGIPVDRVDRRVSASPIPDSPVFTVKATGPTEESAVRLANEVSDSVVLYARQLNDRDPDASALLGEYKKTSSILADREARADALRDQLEDDPSAEVRRSLARARASRSFWRLREEALEERYLAASAGESSSQLIQVLNRADDAKSDEAQWSQILGFAGLIGGLLLGLGAATFVANRRLRKSLAARP